MEHLTLEALSRLVDETPSRSERRHLADCEICSTELDLVRQQTEALRSLPAMRPAPGDWEALEAQLEEEGLIRGGDIVRTGARLFGVRRSWMQAAAALVLFGAGGALGAALAPSDGTLGSSARLVDPATLTVAEAATSEQAAERVRSAEQQYYAAVVRYRELTRGSDAARPDPGRFAAIDALVAASQAAVQQAPDDPFLNGFLVSAVAERQATLRRISSSGSWY